ncbi:MAG TPA: nucleotide disphospho-sugar-binding domain-containing protein [Streptosporangiaceae bacterium]|jgi:UDP:flavonoid glycosyltransferase YjiC (YdhE family)|nr:nucleotide disphospho-sugar-binding domain-containing protein [Streptosporangiaceae bacterium]
MRVLVVSWGWPAHYLPMVPLSWALRLAGHEVLVATQPSLVTVVRSTGLPVATVGRDIADIAALEGGFLRRAAPDGGPPLEWEDLRRYGARCCGKNVANAELMIDDLLDLGSAWRPDLVLYEPTSYAGPLLAARLGVPAVRHTWGIDFAYYQREFEDEALHGLCRRLGLPGVETLGELTIDPCPPSLQVGPDPRVPVPVRRVAMRHVPFNGRAVHPPGLPARTGRPRVCVCWGYSSAVWDPRLDLGAQLTERIADLDVEVVLTGPGRPPDSVSARPNVIVLDRTALHLVFPDCDLAVIHGGLGTMLTAMSCGLPQLVVPQIADRVLNARMLRASGAGEFVFAHECDEQRLHGLVNALLHEERYVTAARRLRAAAESLPGPEHIAELVADLVGHRARPPVQDTPNIGLIPAYCRVTKLLKQSNNERQCHGVKRP